MPSLNKTLRLYKKWLKNHEGDKGCPVLFNVDDYYTCKDTVELLEELKQRRIDMKELEIKQ